MDIDYNDTSAIAIYYYAKKFIGKRLKDILTIDELDAVKREISKYGNNRKGHFGDLVERYLFGIKNNSDASADFPKAGLELKTTPLRPHSTKGYVAKERLVFSMINYMEIVHEDWENSSFLKKNSILLLMFYLYSKEDDLTEYTFKIVHLLKLLEDMSDPDIKQIRKDWQFIVDKIRRGEAHLLSEADTSYLGAATKSRSSSDRRDQPYSAERAKPRAFAFKQSYLNTLIQGFRGKNEQDMPSLFDDPALPKTIEENVQQRFAPYIGMTNLDIETQLGITYDKRPKNHRRLLVNMILGSSGSNKIRELEKANITMRVIALEPSGRLVESISFPKFDYRTIVEETWEDSELYEQLTTKRFLFVVFRKQKGGGDILEKVRFWNFPMNDIDEARKVWEETVRRIKGHRADSLPGIKDSGIIHVRPHARNGKDLAPTGYGTFEIKKSFWLNAKYVQNKLEEVRE